MNRPLRTDMNLAMAVAKSLDKPIFLYTEHTEDTVFFVE